MFDDGFADAFRRRKKVPEMPEQIFFSLSEGLINVFQTILSIVYSIYRVCNIQTA